MLFIKHYFTDHGVCWGHFVQSCYQNIFGLMLKWKWGKLNLFLYLHPHQYQGFSQELEDNEQFVTFTNSISLNNKIANFYLRNSTQTIFSFFFSLFGKLCILSKSFSSKTIKLPNRYKFRCNLFPFKFYFEVLTFNNNNTSKTMILPSRRTCGPNYYP